MTAVVHLPAGRLAHPDALRAWLTETDDVAALRRVEGRVTKFAELLARESETSVAAAEYLRVRNDIARRGGQLLAAAVQRHTGKRVTDTLSATLGVDSDAAAQAISSRWQRIAAIPEPDYVAYQEREEPTQAGLLKLAKQARARAIGNNTPASPRDDAPTEFPTIVIDPPWRYSNKATRGAAEDHYPTMSLNELADLKIPATDNAHLYLWVTNAFLRDAFGLLDAWGFTYKACLTWCKPQIGTGNYFRNATEHVYFALRGSLPTLANNIPTWFEANRTRHSAKPEPFYDIVERSSPGPYHEMFARRRRLGWHVWGNEA